MMQQNYRVTNKDGLYVYLNDGGVYLAMVGDEPYLFDMDDGLPIGKAFIQTGFQDDRDVDIYFGDQVVYIETDLELIGEIGFDNGSFTFKYDDEEQPLYKFVSDSPLVYISVLDVAR